MDILFPKFILSIKLVIVWTLKHYETSKRLFFPILLWINKEWGEGNSIEICIYAHGDTKNLKVQLKTYSCHHICGTL